MDGIGRTLKSGPTTPRPTRQRVVGRRTSSAARRGRGGATRRSPGSSDDQRSGTRNRDTARFSTRLVPSPDRTGLRSTDRIDSRIMIGITPRFDTAAVGASATVTTTAVLTVSRVCRMHASSEVYAVHGYAMSSSVSCAWLQRTELLWTVLLCVSVSYTI
jgi:hypothetical protein